MKKMMLIQLLIVFSYTYVYSQDHYAQWNKNYPEKNIIELLAFEQAYSDSVDNGLIRGESYNRMDNMRFYAVFTGKKKVMVIPGHDKFEVPMIDKRAAQVLSIHGDSVSLMDNESFENFDLNIPEELKLKKQR
jgi:hypothetical protein